MDRTLKGWRMRYSRELRNIVYFEVYGYNIIISGRGRRYVKYDGLVLSSFRPIDVLCTEDMDDRLRVERRRKYVLIGRSSSNPSIFLSPSDDIVYIYDRKELERKTGKRYTIPERIRMRISTTSIVDEGGFSRYFWTDIPDIINDYLQGSGVYPVNVVFLLLYTSGREGIGMKMFRLRFDEEERLDLRWVRRLNYQYGYVFSGPGYVTVVPMYSRYVSFSDVHRALSSMKSRERVSEEDTKLWFEDDGSSFF